MASALENAWVFLKEQRNAKNDPLKEYRTMAQELDVHPASLQLALNRLEQSPEAKRRAGWIVDEDDRESNEFFDHLQEGEHSTGCHPCGWRGKGHELHREHPLDEGTCPNCGGFGESTETPKRQSSLEGL